MLSLLGMLMLTGYLNTDSMQAKEITSTKIDSITLKKNEANSVAMVEHDAVSIADAAMYRGTVTNIAKTTSGTVWYLRVSDITQRNNLNIYHKGMYTFQPSTTRRRLRN